MPAPAGTLESRKRPSGPDTAEASASSVVSGAQSAQAAPLTSGGSLVPFAMLGMKTFAPVSGWGFDLAPVTTTPPTVVVPPSQRTTWLHRGHAGPQVFRRIS